MNIKTSLLEEYVNFVETTKKPNKYILKIITLSTIIIALFFLCCLMI